MRAWMLKSPNRWRLVSIVAEHAIDDSFIAGNELAQCPGHDEDGLRQREMGWIGLVGALIG